MAKQEKENVIILLNRQEKKEISEKLQKLGNKGTYENTRRAKRLQDYTDDEQMAVYMAIHSGDDSLYDLAVITIDGAEFFERPDPETGRMVLDTNIYLTSGQRFKMGGEKSDFIQNLRIALLNFGIKGWNPKKGSSLHNFIVKYMTPNVVNNTAKELTGISVNKARAFNDIRRITDYLEENGLSRATPEDLYIAALALAQEKTLTKTNYISRGGFYKNVEEMAVSNGIVSIDDENYVEQATSSGIQEPAGILQKVEEEIDPQDFEEAGLFEQALSYLEPGLREIFEIYIECWKEKYDMYAKLKAEMTDGKEPTTSQRRLMAKYAGLPTPKDVADMYKKIHDGEEAVLKESQIITIVKNRKEFFLSKCISNEYMNRIRYKREFTGPVYSQAFKEDADENAAIDEMFASGDFGDITI